MQSDSPVAQQQPEQLFGVSTLAQMLLRAVGTVRKDVCLARWNRVPPPSLRVGRQPRWRPRDVERWLDERACVQARLGFTDPDPEPQPRRRRGRPRLVGRS